MEIQINDLQDGYLDIIEHIQKHAWSQTVRGLDTLEQRNATIILPYADRVTLPLGTGRRVNVAFAAVEALQVISGSCHPGLMARANPLMSQVLVNSSEAAVRYAAYGPRISSQLYHLVRLLHRDPTTRQAVLTIWQPGDIGHTGDLPCTLSLQFMLRNHDELEMHVTMRSNDVWLGLAYDMFVFTQLQLSIVHWLNALRRNVHVSPGAYIHHAASLHLYKRDITKLDNLHRPDHSYAIKPLPNGVCGGDAPSTVAALLLTGWANDAETRQNGWYADRLASVGVVQCGGPR